MRVRPWRQLGVRYALNLPIPIALFFITYSIACMWHNLGVFERNDILFDADPQTQLSMLMTGSGEYRLSHPLLVFILKLFLVVPSTWRAVIALMVGPLTVSITALLVSIFVRTVQKSDTLAHSMSLIYSCSFSVLIFGSLTEHFTFDSLITALAFTMAAFELNHDRPFKEWIWLVLGMLAAGLTLTNTIAVFACMAAGKRSLPLAALLAGGAALLSIALGTGLEHLVFSSSPSTLDESKWIEHYFVTDPLAAIKRGGAFIVSLGDAFISSPILIYREEASQNLLSKATLHYVHYNPWPYLKGFTVGALIIFGVLKFPRLSCPMDRLAMASSGIIIFYLSLLSVWGTELFLYSQYIVFPAIILLVSRIYRRNMAVPIALFIVALEIPFNVHELWRLFDGLSG